ncbi:MAG: DUF1810 domain-containing protein [Hydrogenophaga sp.]|jgi:uncharacterized protein (DUF1810 family)|nr:DUF1810 domain-containing protein [Hydrogenophaga sp.]
MEHVRDESVEGRGGASDPFNLQRFVDAQTGVYDTALRELRQGHKQTHWIWFVLPQLQGLGRSSQARFYGITGRAEAAAYWAHPLLGPRLLACVQALNRHAGQRIETILGPVDAQKFGSCLTLFDVVAPHTPELAAALQHFYAGARCEKTLAWVGAISSPPDQEKPSHD